MKTSSLCYTIVVLGPVYGTQQTYLAYQFALKLLESKHMLKHVFFYSAGVSNANCQVNSASDDFDISAAWQRLAREENVSLSFCASAGLRLGINKKVNIMSGFEVGSLTGLSEAIANSDRVIQF